MHAKTHKRELVDALFELGLSISYDCLLTISTVLCNTLCKQFELEKTVCPPKLKLELFTTAAIDNIDHNPSSTTAQGSFHGTSISIFQHPQVSLMEWNVSLYTLSSKYNHASKRGLEKLPQSYTNLIFQKK